MHENLNIQVLNTAAESQWQNGVCERNHAVVDRCIEKILEDQPDMPLPKALYWAINAKNALQMWSGFSSYQLVFGRNPNIPSTLTDNLPALEGTTINHSFAKHIHAIHSARSAFIEAESSEKVRRALRIKLRTQSICFKQGDKVFDKRNDSNHWRGPEVVTGQDGKIVLIRHGSIYIRASTCRILKFGEEFTTTPDNISNDNNSEKAKILPKQKVNETEKVNETDFFDDTDYDDCILLKQTKKKTITL